MTREEAIAELREDKALYESDICYAGDGSPDGRLLQALDMAIEALQTEVVRCKDCRWYEQKQKNLPYNMSKRYCNRSCVLATKENDFCSYGERRKP